uniref:Glycosyltransferase n=1 Tax=viral metagenome TaxID=1070528 RepID=A0A6C0B2W8_9ZZZZ
MVYATVHMLIINEEKYIDGACISAYTYRKFGNPDIEHVVMIDKTIKDTKKLKRFFDKIVTVDPIYVKSSFELSSAERVEKYASWIDYANTKWYCLMLKEYKKVLLVDVDTLAMKSYGHVFGVEAPAWSIVNMDAHRDLNKSAFFRKYSRTGTILDDTVLKHYSDNNICAGGFTGALPVNASVVLLKPSITDFKKLIKMIDRNVKKNGYYKAIVDGLVPNGPDESSIYEYYKCVKNVSVTILGTEFLTSEHKRMTNHPVWRGIDPVITNYSTTIKPWLKPDKEIWPDEKMWKVYRTLLKPLL